ncbi:MAG: CpsD/CapB family tyrosine-protein kinase [Chloroflexi bacterium]|nr:CpsD/CapB family tyrosine-protein kinase [Chloroflexota bacterium]
MPESRDLDRAKPLTSGVPAYIETESFNMIRANLRYFNVGRPVKSILITSAAPGEGKSTLAWNLAAAAAAAGDLVLLIEADLRHPSKLTGNEINPDLGLGALLAGNAELSTVLKRLPVAAARGADGPPRHMDVVPAGAVPPNPGDLLEASSMARLIAIAEERYDLVVIDASPTAVVSDAIPLVKKVSGVLVVARLGRSTRTAVQQLRRQLENLDAPVLGVVVNSMTSPVAQYGYGYGYGYERPKSASTNGKPSTAPPELEPDSYDVGAKP